MSHSLPRANARILHILERVARSTLLWRAARFLSGQITFRLAGVARSLIGLRLAVSSRDSHVTEGSRGSGSRPFHLLYPGFRISAFYCTFSPRVFSYIPYFSGYIATSISLRYHHPFCSFGTQLPKLYRGFSTFFMFSLILFTIFTRGYMWHNRGYIHLLSIAQIYIRLGIFPLPVEKSELFLHDHTLIT